MRRAGRAFVRLIVMAGLLLGGAAAVYFGYRLLTAPTVTVTRVVEGPVVQAFYATGTLSADREYPVRSAVEGIVTEVLVDKGEEVRRGQKLAVVRVEEYIMRHSQARADHELRLKQLDEETSPVLLEFDKKLASAQQKLEVAQREYERLKKLRDAGGTATQVEVDRANERLQPYWAEVESLKKQRAARKLELQRDLEVARAALEIAQWNLDEQTIRSPIDGVVLDRPVTVGTRLKVNDHVLQVADVRPEQLVMRAAVDEEDKTRLCLGQRVVMTLYSYPQRSFEGKVRKIYPKADPTRRTFEVDVSATPVDPGFSAGMTGELAFVVDAKDRAVIVPSQAVQGGGVWVVRDGRLVRPAVKLGLRSVERTEIVEGLSVGEVVVISPMEDANEGQAVRVSVMDPVAAANLNKPAESAGFKGFH